jgi:T5orf172 domain/Domain of unknown function (DUF4268)
MTSSMGQNAGQPLGEIIIRKESQSKTGGYVYVMTNPAMPGLVKIGSTASTPDERARQLSSSTGVPRPYQVVAFRPFDDELHAERELQAVFAEYRVKSSRREFYEVDVEQAREALFRLSVGKDGQSTSTPSTSAQSEKPISNTNASVLGLPYWSRFNALRAEQKLLPRFENAGPRFFHRHFLVTPSKGNGNRNIHYEGRIRINSPQVSMRLIFKTADNIKELFDLVAQDRDKIEQEVGFSLLWLRDRGRYESHIAVERDDDPRNVSEWDQQHAWLSEIVSSFEQVIRSRIAKLPS